jgi:hypothetical protein
VITGGCLCGALRYEASAPPDYMGHCYCADCRKASGSGFIPFMGFAASAITITGDVLLHTATHPDGRTAERNSCPTCGGLVFGGIRGESGHYNIYAGSLDDASQFVPTVAIFTRDVPAWAMIPPGLKRFEAMPG